MTTCFLFFCIVLEGGETNVNMYTSLSNPSPSDMTICIDHLTLYTSSNHLQDLINKDVTKNTCLISLIH